MVPGCWGCPGLLGVSQVSLGAAPGGPGPPTHAPLPQRCLKRILQGLQHYRDLLGSDIFTARRLPRLEATLDQLLGLVQVRSWGAGGAAAGGAGAWSPDPPDPAIPQQEHGRPPRHSLAPSETWTHPLLQRLALQRLQSFAAIMSRVFTHSASAR